MGYFFLGLVWVIIILMNKVDYIIDEESIQMKLYSTNAIINFLINIYSSVSSIISDVSNQSTPIKVYFKDIRKMETVYLDSTKTIILYFHSVANPAFLAKVSVYLPSENTEYYNEKIISLISKPLQS
jgi:hypothetical protein